MNTLSIQRPRPSIEILTPVAASVPMKAALVNWLPWSVLNISGRPKRAKASSSADTQNDVSIVFDRRQASAWPFLGSRRMTAMLNGKGCRINRKRVQRLMRKMGMAALGPKPRTTKPAPGHKIFPYLLRHMVIDRPNQVWVADITYVPIGQGFLYLVAIIDWASRAVDVQPRCDMVV
ncbi:helix-turn-helix protein [Bradyrhizobium yuanmingense]|nr:helix-turn-helix protein [Bradyrhizobium yuanmingense]